MAKLLGEEEFSIMFHQGKKDNIQLSLVGERTILAIIFDDKTTAILSSDSELLRIMMRGEGAAQ